MAQPLDPALLLDPAFEFAGLPGSPSDVALEAVVDKAGLDGCRTIADLGADLSGTAMTPR
jgi:hypothetical protein